MIDSGALVQAMLEDGDEFQADEFMKDYQQELWTVKCEVLPVQDEPPFQQGRGGPKVNASFYLGGKMMGDVWGTFTEASARTWAEFLNWLQRRKPYNKAEHYTMHEWVADAQRGGYTVRFKEYLAQRKRMGESEEDEIEFSPEEVADIVAAGMGPEALAQYIRTTGDRSHAVDLNTFIKDYTNVGGNYKLHLKIVQAIIKMAIAGLSDGPRYKIWIYAWVLKNTVMTWEKTFLLVDVPLHHRSAGNMNFQKALLLVGAQTGVMNKSAEELPAVIERVMKDYEIKG